MRGLTRLFRSSSFLFAAVFSTLFAIVTAVWAVDELGLFELEGDAKGASPVMMIPDDWEEVYDGDDAADVSVFISSADEDPSVDISYFTGGGSKDVRDVSQWQSTENNVAPDKDQILDAFAAAYINPSDYPAVGPVVHDAGDRLLFFGLDRFAVSGDAQVGFWFLKGQVSVDIDGDPNTADPFIGNHQIGDILVLSDFVKGGKVSEIRVFEWVGGNKPLQMLGSGGDCGDAHDFACATVNNPGDDSGSPWPFVPKAGSAGTFPDGAFFEGGINLTKLGVEEGCFNTFIAETRSSQSVTAQLKDYALGAFPLCQADVTTEVHDKDHNDITFATDILVLTEVHDKVFVTGSGITIPPDPSGDVSFQLYTGLDCMPGNESGSAEVVGLGSGNPASAESTPFMPAAGEWSFSASYAGDSNYPSAMLPGEHCEPFTVIKRDASVATNIHDSGHNDITGGSAFVSETVHDKAFVNGDGVAPTPTGTVTFYRYATGNCSGSPMTETKSLSGGMAESSDFLLSASGGLSYLATYSGDQYYNEIKLADLDKRLVSAGGHCEPLTVNKRVPSIVTFIHEGPTVGPAHNAADIKGGNIDVGGTVHDKASVSGAGNMPTGTVTFYRYPTADCSGTPVLQSNVNLSNGMAESSAFTTVLAGGLSYLATYSGDTEYFPITLADVQKDLNTHCEPLTINKIKADIATNIHEGATVGPNHNAPDIQGGSIDAGGTVHDKATVSGALSTPTGTVTFYRYATDNCSGSVVSEAGVALSGGMSESSAFTTTTSGGLSYLATYSGDGVYFPITLADVQKDLNTHCEPLTINKIPADIATNIHKGPTVGPAHVATDIQGGSINAGETVHDKATVSGLLAAPTGTVTFYRYPTGNCSGTPVNQSGVALVNGMAESSAFTTSESGGLSYLATYSGDNTYLPVTLDDVRGDLGKHCEPLTVNKVKANIATNIHSGPTVGSGHNAPDIQGGSIDVGDTVHDKANVSGGLATPTGTVTFYRYTTANCTGTPLSEAGIALSAGMAESSAFTSTTSGGLSYLATYSGDNVYFPITLNDVRGDLNTHCEPLTVNKVDANIATNIHAGPTVGSGHNAPDIQGGSINAGETVHDKATVSGLQGTPTGTVTFYRYPTGNCSGTPISESGVALGSGMAESIAFTTSVSGGLSYLATYSGDNVYNPITLNDVRGDLNTHCEPLTVNKLDANIATNIHAGPTVGSGHNAPDIQGGSINAGETVHDKATVGGSLSIPTGTVTFYRYPTGNCSGTPISESGIALGSGMAESSAFTTSVSGGLSYLATYSGNNVYNPITLNDVRGDLNTHCEPLTVNKLDANIATNIHAGPTVGSGHNAPDIQGGSINAGETVHDKANVGGSLSVPSGTVTFYRYPTGNCSGTPVSESGIALSGGMAESSAFTTSVSGGLSYLATYSGDAVYNPVTLSDVRGDLGTHCEPLTVNKLDANVATNIHVGERVGPGHVDTDVQGGQIDVGNIIHDKANVSGSLTTPSGTVTFHRYATLDCSGGAVQDGPWTLGGDGTQESSSFTPGVGDLSYLATYSGDSVYNPVTLGDLAGNLPAHCEPLTVVGVFEACTPGYWKQPQHFGNWAAPYSPVPIETLYVDAFGVGGKLPGLPGKYKEITLLGALEAGGNTDHEALLRHSAAALLNTANSDVNYPLSTQEVIMLVRSAFANGTTAAAHALLGGYNETFDCPLARADL